MSDETAVNGTENTPDNQLASAAMVVDSSPEGQTPGVNPPASATRDPPAPKSPDEPFHLEWQPGKSLGLRSRKDGRLVADHQGKEIPLKASHAFPWKEPRRYISLRDDKGREVVFVEELDALEAGDKALVETELAFRTHIARVQRIHVIKEILEEYWWDVETDSGPRTFLASRHEDARIFPDGKVVVKDRYGELFMIEDHRRLDAISREKFLKVVDC